MRPGSRKLTRSAETCVRELQRLREQNWELKKDLLDARNACRELETLSETLKSGK
jgi:hypothetical protein